VSFRVTRSYILVTALEAVEDEKLHSEYLVEEKFSYNPGFCIALRGPLPRNLSYRAA
jgi:hypothetical protein